MAALPGCGPEVTEVPPATPTAAAEAPTAAATAEAGYGYEFQDDKFGKAAPSAQPAASSAAAGRLPPEVIQHAVRGKFGVLRACYETGLKANPKLAGRVSVRFVIGKEGTVTTATDGGSDLGDPAAVKCVVDAFLGFTFPAPSGGIVTVTYPIAFSPGEQPLKERVVGTWQFDFSGERRAAVEAELKKKAGKDEKKLAKLMKEAEEEAAQSRFEITADTVTSLVGDKVLFRLKYQIVKEDKDTLRVKVVGKPEGKQKVAKDGEELVLVGEKGFIAFKDDDNMIMTDPKKGAMLFKRK
jgi:hypothetical protein